MAHLSDLDKSHIDKWVIPKDMVEYEKMIATLEREKAELTKLKNDWQRAAQSREKECQGLLEKVKELAAENVVLEQRLRELVDKEGTAIVELLHLIYRIRQAVGDDGKMMQDELVDHIAGLGKKVRELEDTISAMQMSISCHENFDDCRIEELEAENAALRKRLEPIEFAYSLYADYPMSAMTVRNAYRVAIKQCMELKEGIS